MFYNEPNPQVESAKDEAAHKHGENGAYQACEKMARKIRLNGPEYYWGGRPRRAPTYAIGPERSQRIHCPICGSGSYKKRFGKMGSVNTCARCGHSWSNTGAAVVEG